MPSTEEEVMRQEIKCGNVGIIIDEDTSKKKVSVIVKVPGSTAEAETIEASVNADGTLSVQTSHWEERHRGYY